MIDSATQARNAIRHKVLHAGILTFSMISFACNAINARPNNDSSFNRQPVAKCIRCLDIQQTTPNLKVRHPRRLKTSHTDRAPGPVFADQAEMSTLDWISANHFSTPDQGSTPHSERRASVAGDRSAWQPPKRRPSNVFILGQRRHDSWCNGCSKERTDSAAIKTTRAHSCGAGLALS